MKPLKLLEILQSTGNLADKLDKATLAKIGAQIVRDVGIDKRSREEWLVNYKTWLDVAMQVRVPKNSPWPKAANIKYPLLIVAAIQFQARAYPAIVDGSNLVKGRVLGPDPDGAKRDKADRVGQHMTWQLLYRMPQWEEDTDRLLLLLPIVGCVMRKSFYDSMENCNRSEMVTAEDFIINYWAKSLETAPRYTQVLHYYPYEVAEFVKSGLWHDVPVQAETGSDDENAVVDFWECHCSYDLDGDGYPEHYVVTCTTEGVIARIAPCFAVEEVLVKTPKGVAKLVDLVDTPDQIGAVVTIKRRQYFTKYGFIPAPDGSFYDTGFGGLLQDLSGTIDTLVNQMLDAGTLQNAQGGFIGSGVNIKSGNMKFTLGEWKRTDVTGGTLRENIVPLALPGPSAVLFNLLGMLIDAAKEITAVQDVMTGQGTANQPATTTLALIEQGQKVMSGIFKRIHRAFGKELRVLRTLNRDYLDEEEYFQLNDSEESTRIGREDYADDDLDVVPVSDPTTINDMQKMARAQALMAFNGDPLVNQGEIRRRYLESIGEPDIGKLLEVPEPQPDPKMLMDGLKLQIEKVRADNDGLAKKASASKALADAATVLAALGLIPDAAALAGDAAELGGDVEDGQGPVPAMEGQPVDEGISGMVEGPPASPDDLVGGGPDLGPGDTGAGGPAGPAISDQL